MQLILRLSVVIVKIYMFAMSNGNIEKATKRRKTPEFFLSFPYKIRLEL